MTLAPDVSALVDAAALLHAGTATGDALTACRARLDEPMRVAIVGRIKAGKSTLLNALVGERIAATDAQECTQVVTWYRHGPSPHVTMFGTDGSEIPLAYTVRQGQLSYDLGGVALRSVDRIEVGWPSPILTRFTLIDTPGIDAASGTALGRTEGAVLPDGDRPGAADVALYVLQNLHASDIGFLEAFTGGGLSMPSPLHAIGVLGRADEVGVARPEAMRTASSVAARVAADQRVRRLCSTVLPLAGLPAMGGIELTETRHRWLRDLAQEDAEVMDDLLSDASGWCDEDTRVGVDPAARRDLLDSLGLWGTRCAVARLRRTSMTARQLSQALVDASGLTELRRTLAEVISPRQDLLKARTALMTLMDLTSHGTAGLTPALIARIDVLASGCHELIESETLAGLRNAELGFDTDHLEEAERLLGGSGVAAAARLGLDPAEPAERLQQEIRRTIDRWRTISESPFATPQGAHVARVVVRSAEGLATPDSPSGSVGATGTSSSRTASGLAPSP